MASNAGMLYCAAKANLQSGRPGMLSPSLRKFAIGYVLLVGVPLLGVIGNLHLGRKLSAPIAVDGVWDITIAALLTNDDCAQSLSARSLVLAIAQSGNHLLISSSADLMNGVDGQIDGRRVTAASLPLSSGNNKNRCADTKVSVSADINSTRPVAMDGELSVEGCSACPPLRFTALKRSPDKSIEKR